MASRDPPEPGRPLPDDLLLLARRAEQRAHEGRLTIYLGYAPGVGKTYAMLHDAQQWRQEGVEVLAGHVETHGRPETDALAARLETIPSRRVVYQGIPLREMDLEAVLRRRPPVVLVDELAHTNAPESRHRKRYQDILELLHAGISVCTTVNIQHIESLNDAVAQITGIRITETVPDTFFERADDIRLIDLSPEDLQIRLRAGKVYVKDIAQQAIDRYFSTGNLLALRQLALRYLAAATDTRMVNHMRTRAIPGPWPAAERLVVGIRPGPMAERMVRAAYRLSARFNAEWVVLCIDTQSQLSLTDQENAWITEAMDTAHKLGGRTVRYRGADVADELLRYARRNNVTMIMLGKPHGIDVLFSPVYRIMRRSRGIDIYLFDPKGEKTGVPLSEQLHVLTTWDYLFSMVMVASVTLLSYFLTGILSPANLLIIQLLPVVVAALFFRRGAALFTAVVSILAFDFLFVEPYYTFSVASWQYFIAFIVYVVVALVISHLATRIRHLLPQIWKSEAEVAAVAGLSRQLVEADTRQEVFQILASHMQGLGGGSMAILGPTLAGLQVLAGDAAYPLSEKERTIAQWAYDNGEPAGRGTDNLPAGTGHYVPMKAHAIVFGVLAFAFQDPDTMLTPENREIFQTMAYLGALALERMK
jgi:two-component system sensor histidine kinase KdpD